MIDLKDELRHELEDYDFSCDLSAFEPRYRKNRAVKLKGSAAACAGLLVAGVAVLCWAFRSTAPKQEIDMLLDYADLTQHSFLISASAAEVSKEYSEELSDSQHQLLLTSCSMQIEVTYHEDPSTAKTFSIEGKAPIIPYGDDIKSLIYHSEISSFYWPDADRWVNDQEVTYDPEDPLDSALYWGLPDEFNRWCEEMNTIEGEVDFSALPRDKVTVTAVFSDGTRQMQQLSLWFNNSGYLVIETEDGFRYHDYDDSAEYNPFDYEAHVIDPENVSSITVTLNNTGREIEVANIPGMVSELWAMRLYEELPDEIISKKNATILVRMNDGSSHKINVSPTMVVIDDERAYRAGVGTADRLLSFCYGLLKKNEIGYVVYGSY